MKKLRSALSLVLALCMMLSLAACGGAATPAAEAPATEAPAEAPASEAPVEAPAEAPAPEEPAETPEEAPPEHAITFPGADGALIDYINEYSLPLSQEKATLSFMRNAVNLMGPMAELGYAGFNDFPYQQKLEELTNVHIDYVELDFFTATEKMALYIASGDYADMIADLTYTGGLPSALTDGIIVDLTKLVPEIAPNYNYVINSNPDITNDFLTEGSILSLRAPYDDFRDNQGLVIRTDWLADVGMDKPVTYDQLHDVLMAFKTEKNAGNAIYMNADCAITDLVEGFDIQTFSAGGTATDLPYYVDGGEVKCTLDQDAYREYLQMLNKWYTEGLFDSDFISIEFDPFSSYLTDKITTDQMGVWCTSTEGIDTYTVPIAPIASPVQAEGDMNHITEMSLLVDSSDTVITSCCEDVELALKWLDYWYSEDGILMYNYGLEGDAFTLEDGVPVFTDAAVNNSFGVPVSNYLRGSCAFGVFSSVLLRYRTAEFNTPLTAEAWDVWTDNLDGTMALPASVALTMSESEEYGAIYGDLTTYAIEMIPRFVIGDVGFDQWDSYVAELDSLGLYDCIAIEQGAYDRFMER